MNISANTTVTALAARVCQGLADRGIAAVLTGGAVVSIYSDNEFQSDDLDFISPASLERLKAVMQELGFHQEEGKYFSHPDTQFLIEFPPAPIMLGGRYIPEHEVGAIKTEVGLLRILTPTQCVMDRLASFYHWNDYQSLLQALAVARKQPVDLEQVKQWSAAENAADKYQKFLGMLVPAGRAR